MQIQHNKVRQKAHAKPETTKDKTIAGPAYCAAACPVKTKIPAPIIAPIPKQLNFWRLVSV